MSSHQAAAKLNELMAKKGIHPTYELVCSKTGTHINEFTMRINSSIVPNGPIYSATASGKSKKEAKHQAALVFMQKYLDFANNNPSVQTLCLKFHLREPEFNDKDVTGPPHSRLFTTRCRVSNLVADGQGTTKSEAKLQATTKMIQLLMQEAKISEIFESPQLTTTPNSNEIVCLIDNLKGPHLPVKMGVFGRRSSTSSSSDGYSGSNTCSIELDTASKCTDTPVIGIGSINNCKKVESIAESNDDSMSNMSLISFDDDSQPINSKTRSKSMNNLTDLSESSKNFFHKQAIKKIEATLENVEKQLHNEILDTLEVRELPRKKSVIVLSHEYEVYLNHESRPKIFEGKQQCTDLSIIMACLTKLLMDLKDHAKSSSKVVNN